MVSGAQLLQDLDVRRRRAYGVTAVILGVLTVGYIVRDVTQHHWVSLLSNLFTLALCLGIVLALRVWRTPTERLNRLIAAALLLAALPEFQPLLTQPSVNFRSYLSLLLICALWFGLLPPKLAFPLSGGAYLGFSALVLSRPQHDLSLLTYLGGVTVVVGMVASFGQQVNRKQQEAALFQHEALTDHLTGLPNRRAATQLLEELWNSRVTASINSFAVLMIDLDHFKNVNDQFTHTVGDQVLQAFSVALQDLSGAPSVLTRWGGEEFMLILPRTTAHQAYELTSLLHGKTLHLPGDLPAMQFSAGAALSHEATSLDELLTLTDRRLHAAKQSGRHQVKWNDHLSTQPDAIPPAFPDHSPDHSEPQVI